MKQMNERVEQWAKKAGKYKYAFLVLLVGLVLLLLPTGSRRETAAADFSCFYHSARKTRCQPALSRSAHTGQ